MEVGSLETFFTDDVISELKDWPSLLLNSKVPRCIAKFMLGYNIVQFTIGLLYLIISNDTELWSKYFPIGQGLAMGIASYFILLTKRGQYYDIINTSFLYFWSLRCAGTENFGKIKRGGKIAKFFLVVIIAISVVQAIMCLPIIGDEYDLYLTVKLIIDYMDKWEIPLLILFYSSIIHAGFVILCLLFFLLYLILHLKFQFYLLNKRLGQIENDAKHFDLSVMDQERYQKKMKSELILCIRHHQKLESFTNKIVELMYFPMFFYFTFSVSLFVSIIFYFSHHPELWFRGAIVTGIAICFTFTSCYLAQQLEDESEQVFTSISNLPWYLWNKNNQKVMMIFLCKTRKPIILTCSDIITVNYQLIIGLFRSIYSVVTFFVHMDH